MAAPRCVLVDDDPDFISFVRVCLWRLCPQLEIVAFSSAVEALQFLFGHRTDLLITDFNMPCLNGLQLTHEVRVRESQTRLPIIVMSGDEIESEALAQGANIFVPKRDLLARLASIVEQFNLIGSRPKCDEGHSAPLPKR